jgi:ferredoxin
LSTGSRGSSTSNTSSSNTSDCAECSSSDTPHASSSSRNSSSSTITYRGVEVTAPQGSRLRSALLQGGVSPHNDRAQLINCRGLGTCGTCAVEVR